MSSSQFSLTNNKQSKRFSIDDAFEEETDEAIKVYGATIPRSPTSLSDHHHHGIIGLVGGGGGDCSVKIDNGRSYKLANDTSSRDSDSLIQDCCYDDTSSMQQDQLMNGRSFCLMHPKVRENWRMVLAAATLLIIGLGLLATGTVSLAEPNSSLQGSVFLLAGFICFVPGAYHIVYIYLAAKGKRGYHFHNLPLFT